MIQGSSLKEAVKMITDLIETIAYVYIQTNATVMQFWNIDPDGMLWEL